MGSITMRDVQKDKAVSVKKSLEKEATKEEVSVKTPPKNTNK